MNFISDLAILASRGFTGIGNILPNTWHFVTCFYIIFGTSNFAEDLNFGRADPVVCRLLSLQMCRSSKLVKSIKSQKFECLFFGKCFFKSNSIKFIMIIGFYYFLCDTYQMKGTCPKISPGGLVTSCFWQT